MLEISIIGFFTGVLILIILILNLQSSPLANKLLIGVILPFTLAQLLFYLYVTGLAIYVPYFYRLPSPLYLAMYPMAYLYVRTYILDKEVLSKKDYLHFLPALLHLIQMIPFYLMPLEQKRAIVAEVIQNGEKMIQFKEGGLPAYVQFGILFIQGSIYCFFSYRMILKAKVAQSGNLFQSGKNWLYTFISLMVMVLLSLASSLILPPFDNMEKINFWIISMMISMLMLTCYLFIQPNILYGIPRIDHAKQDKIQKNVLKKKEIRKNINNKANNENNPSYAAELPQKDYIVLQGNETPVYNSIKHDKEFNYLKEYAPLVESFFKNNQPYLNKGYSISKLSEDTDIPVHHLSALFNKVYGIRFNDYINSYRLQYLEVNLDNPHFKDFSQEGLAWQSGFNSRISFFNAVKKLRGISPAEFLQKEK
jgi:AraC-like DNA-binding protein